MLCLMPWKWHELAPHRPLPVQEARTEASYVRRGADGASELANLLTGGVDQPVAVFGPVGCGKSTELAALAGQVLAPEWAVNVLVQLDRLVVYTERTSLAVLAEAVAARVVEHARDMLHLPLSDALKLVPDTVRLEPTGKGLLRRTLNLYGMDLLRAACREVRAASPQGQLLLLLDGAEKAPAVLAREWLSSLAELRGEVAIVAVAPISLTVGPDAAVLVRDYRLFSLGPVTVDPSIDEDDARQGTRFLVGIAARRLGTTPEELPADLARLMDRAAEQSGGVARAFLQLLQDAALGAAMDGREGPGTWDLDRAISDQGEALLRLLRDGDIAALRAAHDTTGLEVPLERRARFLSHGILLEYRSAGGRVVRVAPPLHDKIQQEWVSHG
jgi:hypothetical protein